MKQRSARTITFTGNGNTVHKKQTTPAEISKGAARAVKL